MTNDPAVMEAFDFTEQDLAANQNGTLSAAHNARLLRNALRLYLIFATLALFSSVMIRLELAVTLGCAALLAAMFVGGLLIYTTYRYSLTRGTLYAIQGELRLTTGEPALDASDISSYILQIETLHFNLSRVAYEALQPYMGEFGTVYFLSSQPRLSILSIDIGGTVDLDRVWLWGENRSSRRKPKKR